MLLERFIVLELINSIHFMLLQFSLPCSQETDHLTYPETNEFSSRLAILFP